MGEYAFVLLFLLGNLVAIFVGLATFEHVRTIAARRGIMLSRVAYPSLFLAFGSIYWILVRPWAQQAIPATSFWPILNVAFFASNWVMPSLVTWVGVCYVS